MGSPLIVYCYTTALLQYISRATLLLNAGGSLWVPDTLIILCQVTSAKLCRTMKGAGQKNNGPKTHTRMHTHTYTYTERERKTRSRIWALASICIKREREGSAQQAKSQTFSLADALSASLCVPELNTHIT